MSDISAVPQGTTGELPTRCDEGCWKPRRCDRCGRTKKPHGRSVPIEAANGYCDQDCPGYEPNVRHLWDEHDDARHFTDPAGWLAHTKDCEVCGYVF
jgi:hypothetical protein